MWPEQATLVRATGSRELLQNLPQEETAFLKNFPFISVTKSCSLIVDQFNLIWTSTPAARSSFIRASTVLSVGSTISIIRL